MITYDDLKRFCSTWELQPALLEPKKFEDEGFWCASDNKRLLYADFTIASTNMEEKKREGRYPNVFAVFDPRIQLQYTHELTLAALKEAYDSIKEVDEYKQVPGEVEMVECPCCSGSETVTVSESVHFRGKHYWVDEEVECPFCHGYGKVPDTDSYNYKEDDPETFIVYNEVTTGKKVKVDNSVMNINGSYIKSVYLKDVIELMDKYKIERCKICLRNNSQLFFCFEHMWLLIMATYLDGNGEGWEKVTVKAEPIENITDEAH